MSKDDIARLAERGILNSSVVGCVLNPLPCNHTDKHSGDVPDYKTTDCYQDSTATTMVMFNTCF